MGMTEPNRTRLQRMARLCAQEKRHELRIGSLGKTDPFQLLVEQGIIHIRKPLGSESARISGFISKTNGFIVVCTNSSKSLGHERFAAAHELYHFFYDLHDRTKEWNHLSYAERFVMQDEEIEYLADQFAVHFMMPEDAVFHFINLFFPKEHDQIKPEHVVVLQHQFGVSYDAMTLRLLECEIICSSQYEHLRAMGKDIDFLKKVAKQEGIMDSYFEPKHVFEVPRKYFHILRSNFEANYISFYKLRDILKMLGKRP